MNSLSKTVVVFVAGFLFLISCKNSRSDQPAADSLSNVTSQISVDPLPSWNEGETKKAITDFVTATSTEGSSAFVPAADRIAVFDNDGTLWAEQPLYFQLFYAFDRIREIAPQHPEWKNKEPFKSIIEGDIKKALASGEKGLMSIMTASAADMSGDEYDSIVRNWTSTAKHPVSKKSFTEMVYQPMLELLDYLRSKEYKTFIVSGGDIDFMRAWAEKVYGIPPQQVVGSSLKVKYEMKDSMPVIYRMPEFGFLDDGPGKPIGIYQHIGKRPVFAAGNSDGDYQMLQWTSSGKGPRMGVIVHHTDSTREWAYDRNSHIGKLDRGLDDASKYGWKLIDMKNDWKVIYPFDKK